MTIHYSPSLHAFFDTAIHGELPVDATELTLERHQELLDAQAAGATIIAGADGRPQIRRPCADERRARAIRMVKREAARRITAISPVWRQLNDQRAPSDEGAARFAAIDGVRAASDTIEQAVLALPAKALANLDIALHPLWPAD